jgi:hypothetical protein
LKDFVARFMEMMKKRRRGRRRRRRRRRERRKTVDVGWAVVPFGGTSTHKHWISLCPICIPLPPPSPLQNEVTTPFPTKNVSSPTFFSLHTGVYRDLISTMRKAPSQIPVALGNLRQELLSEKETLRRKIRHCHDPHHVHIAHKGLMSRPGPKREEVLYLFHRTIKDLWTEFKNLERPFLVASGRRAEEIRRGDYWGESDVEEKAGVAAAAAAARGFDGMYKRWLCSPFRSLPQRVGMLRGHFLSFPFWVGGGGSFSCCEG